MVFLENILEVSFKIFSQIAKILISGGQLGTSFNSKNFWYFPEIS